MQRFKALIAEQIDGKSRTTLKEIGLEDLPDHDVLVDVAYSTLNYKDGLAVTGVRPIARRFPMVLGIDLAGTVAESKNPKWRAGDRVIVNGFGLSESHWGGYSQRQRVSSDWLVRLPDAFSLAEAMAIGTAGYTSMLSVMALEQAGVKPGGREVIVTGAAGGVGSVAVALLAALGHRVVAQTGRAETHGYLKDLGAQDFIDRKSLASTGAPMQKERWAGGVDSVGGQILANVLAQTAYGGAIAACGLAAGTDLPTTVLPFILRGVSLLGIDSVMAPMPKREEAWGRLAKLLPKPKLTAMTRTEPLSKVPALAEQILQGQIRGRVVIDVNA
jgi:putative YhdH/YhfP family quinone oxidoreductase